MCIYRELYNFLLAVKDLSRALRIPGPSRYENQILFDFLFSINTYTVKYSSSFCKKKKILLTAFCFRKKQLSESSI